MKSAYNVLFFGSFSKIVQQHDKNKYQQQCDPICLSTKKLKGHFLSQHLDMPDATTCIVKGSARNHQKSKSKKTSTWDSVVKLPIFVILIFFHFPYYCILFQCYKISIFPFYGDFFRISVNSYFTTMLYNSVFPYFSSVYPYYILRKFNLP